MCAKTSALFSPRASISIILNKENKMTTMATPQGVEVGTSDDDDSMLGPVDIDNGAPTDTGGNDDAYPDDESNLKDSNNGHGDNRVKIFGGPVVFGCRLDGGVGRHACRVATHFAPGINQGANDRL